MDAIKDKTDLMTPPHFEHTLWINELKFFEDELKIYEHQLEKLVVTKNKELLPRLEQFQNNFIRQKEVLDQLKRDITVHEQKLAWSYNSDKSKNKRFDEIHEGLRDEMEIYKKIFSQLKKDFYAFLIKWRK